MADNVGVLEYNTNTHKYLILLCFLFGIILSGNDLVLKWIRIYIKYQQNVMIKFDLSDHRKTI